MTRLQELAASLGGASQSDLLRGAVVAAKEGVLDGRAPRRARQLAAVASAV